MARSGTSDSTRLSFQPFVVKSLDGTEHPAELGRLRVPEAHAHPEGRTITVAFLRFRSTATAPGPPVVFLPGGPGYPGTLLARTPTYLTLFEHLRGQSDVLVLDQRGSGLSDPTLTCAVRNSLPADAFETEGKAALALGGMVRPCVRLVRNDGIAIEAYNTVESVEDLEDLRKALRVERLRFIAVSYGTELALESIRRHGDRVDRAVLAGTRGPDTAFRLPSVADFQLKRFSTLLASDPQWSSILPDFEGTIGRLLESLERKPASVEVLDLKSRQKQRVRLGAIGLQAIVSTDIGDWIRGPLLPATFASLARGDSTLFRQRVADLVNGVGSGISIMQLSVDCASGGSPERRSLVAREAKTATLGNVRNMLLNPAFCDLIGSVELGPEFRRPIYSTAKVLFLTGTLDGITPAFQAEEVRWGFPNGIHLLVQNGWHETLPYPEAQKVAIDFLAGEDVRGRSISLPTTRFPSIEEAKRFLNAR